MFYFRLFLEWCKAVRSQPETPYKRLLFVHHPLLLATCFVL